VIAKAWLATSSLGALLTLAACGAGAPGEGVTPQAGATGEPEQAGVGEMAAEAGEEAEESSVPMEPLSRRRVTVYFPSVSGNTLHGEGREIFDTASPADRAKQILSDLLSGPTGSEAVPALPPGTQFRQVFVMDGGVAYVDFSTELREGMSGGSSTELMAVYAIVNSVALNIPEVKRVGILVDGRPCDTLNGHLDLRRPLPPKVSLLDDWTGTGRGARLRTPDPQPKG